MFRKLKFKLESSTAMKANKMEKLVTEVVGKLEKLNQADLASELSWCWVSYKNDQNPVGVIEKSGLALAAFKSARDKNSKSVAKKLVEDLEKALA